MSYLFLVFVHIFTGLPPEVSPPSNQQPPRVVTPAVPPGLRAPQPR